MSVEEQEMVNIQAVDFTTLKTMTERIGFVHRYITFNMPNKASTYVQDSSNLSNFIQQMIDYTKSDSEENWRVEELKNVKYGNIEGGICIADNKTLFDVEKCLIIPKLQIVFVVPGEKSVKEGGFNAAHVICLIGLISTMPLMMKFDSVPDPNDSSKQALSVSYEIWERTSENKKDS